MMVVVVVVVFLVMAAAVVTAVAVIPVVATAINSLSIGVGSGIAGLHCPDSRSFSDVRAPSRHALNFLDQPHGACAQLLAHLTAAHTSLLSRPAEPAGGTQSVARRTPHSLAAADHVHGVTHSARLHVAPDGGGVPV